MKIEEIPLDWLANGAIIDIGDGRLLLGWGKKKCSKVRLPFLTPSFYFPSFFLDDDTPWLHYEFYSIVSLKDLETFLYCIPPQPLNNSQIPWEPPSEDLFNRTFEKLQTNFKEGSLLKAVPYVIERGKSRFRVADLQKSLLSCVRYSLQNRGYLYGFWEGMSENRSEGFLGVTPEILFRNIEGDVIETMACAGTKASEEAQSTLISSPKDLKEHSYVVDSIKDSLSRFGVVEVSSLRAVAYSKLTHLITPIKLTPSNHFKPGFDDLVQSLHPTPALGAYPRKIGANWLKEYQKQYHRKRYGAPVGYYLPEQSLFGCYVAIRNVQWTSDSLELMAGCGVLQESICKNEWNEILLKLRSIKEILSL